MFDSSDRLARTGRFANEYTRRPPFQKRASCFRASQVAPQKTSMRAPVNRECTSLKNHAPAQLEISSPAHSMDNRSDHPITKISSRQRQRTRVLGMLVSNSPNERVYIRKRHRTVSMRLRGDGKTAFFPTDEHVVAVVAVQPILYLNR
jgi:hypothetical protein